MAGEVETKQIKRIISFLEQEATEKAEEIKVKTDERCRLIKNFEIQKQRLAIDREFRDKEKLVLERMRTFKSVLRTKNSMMCKSFAFQAIENTQKEVLHVMKIFCEKHKMYPQLLKLMILQAIFMLTERKVGIDNIVDSGIQ